MRIDRFLSNLEYGSRSDIKKYIKQKRVRVNNSIVNNANVSIDLNVDKVYFDNKEVFYVEDICIALNKPSDYICSNIDEAYPSILNLLPEGIVRLGLNICGRLDVDTEGLVILTSSGAYVHQIISPNKNIYKKYLVKTSKKIINLEKFKNGIEILDGRDKPFETQPAEYELLDDYSCILSIKEGKFHQVKRMFEAIDNEVVYLKRLSVGKYNLPDDLQLGEYRIIKIEDII